MLHTIPSVCRGGPWSVHFILCCFHTVSVERFTLPSLPPFTTSLLSPSLFPPSPPLPPLLPTALSLSPLLSPLSLPSLRLSPFLSPNLPVFPRWSERAKHSQPLGSPILLLLTPAASRAVDLRRYYDGYINSRGGNRLRSHNRLSVS